MKKVLSLILAGLMILAIVAAALPTVLAAETTAGADDAYFEVGGKYYSTMNEAFAAANIAYPVNQLKDYTTDESVAVNNATTFNGNGYTVTHTAPAAYWFSINADLTINDATFFMARGFSFNAENLTINNSTLGIHAAEGGNYRATIVTWNQGLNKTININNSTLYSNVSGEAAAIACNGDRNVAQDNIVVNITGASTLARYGSAGGDQNKSIIVFDRTAQAVVNVSADTSFVLKTSSNTADTFTSAITAYSTTESRPCNVTVNVEDGANFVHACMENVTSHSFHNIGKYAPKVTVNGKYDEIKVANDSTVIYNNGTDLVNTTTLADAITNAAADTEIFVLKDITSTATLPDITKNLKIYGLHNRYDVSVTDNRYMGNLRGSANVEIIDFEMFGQVSAGHGGGLVTNGTSVLTLKRTTLLGQSRPAFKVMETSKLILDASYAEVTANAPADQNAIVLNGTDIALTVKNHSIVKKSNIARTDYTSEKNWVLGVAVDGYTQNVANVTVDVENRSKIILNSTTGGSKGGGFAGFRYAKTFVMNVDETSYLVNTSPVVTNFIPFYMADPNADPVQTSDCVATLNIAPGAIVIDNSAVATGAADHMPDHAFVEWTPNKVNEYRSAKKVYALRTNTVSYNGTAYNTLAEAVNAATANGAPDTPITLNGSFATTETGLTIPAGKNVTIDLNGYTASFLGGGYITGAVAGKFTIKNGDMFVTRGVQVGSGGNFTLDGVNATVVANGGESRPVSKITGGTTGAVTFKDSKVVVSNLGKAGEGFILVENNGTVGTVNVVNSTLEMRNGGNSHVQNNAFVGVGIPSVTNVGANVTVDGTSTLVMAKPSGVASIVGDCSATNVTLNLKKGATVKYDVVAGTADLVKTGVADGTTTITDEGANHVFTAAAAKKLTALPTVAPAAGATIVGFTANDGKIYKNGAAYTGTNDITFTTLTYTAADFDMEDGAALRTKSDDFGLRFSSYVSDTFKAALGANAVYGTTVVGGTADPVGNEKAISKEVSKWDANRTDREGKDMFYLAVLAPVEETITEKQFFEIEMSARAYFTVTYADETTETFYSAFDAENTRSMIEVATTLGADYNAVCEYIINVCA